MSPVMPSPLDKTVVYVDMDFTLCDFGSHYLESKRLRPDLQYPHSEEGFFENLAPMPGAVETFNWFLAHPQLEPFILTAPSLRNPHSYTEKRLWVENHLGYEVVHRLIITAHKGLNRGHFLIDDYDSGKGQEYFEGELIKFGSGRFPDWPSVRRYFELIL